MRRDVTNCPKIQSEDRGVNTKEWILVDGREALFKETQIKENGESTYADYAEVLCSDLCKLMEIPCAETELVVRDDKIGCVSYSFCKPGDSLIDMSTVIQNVRFDFDTKNMIVPSTKEIYGVELILEGIDSICSSKKEFGTIKNSFISDLLMDSILDHYDRNPSNIAIHNRVNEMNLSPKYDNGTSLSISVPVYALDGILKAPGSDREKHEKFREKIYSKIGYLGRNFVQYDELESYLFNYYFNETKDFTEKLSRNLTEENIDKILNDPKYDDLDKVHKDIIRMKLIANRDAMLERQFQISQKKVIDDIIFNKAASDNFKNHVNKGTVAIVLPEYNYTIEVEDNNPDYDLTLDMQIPEKIQNIVDIIELSRFFNMPIHETRTDTGKMIFVSSSNQQTSKKEFTKREKNLLKWITILESIQKAKPKDTVFDDVMNRLGFVKEDRELIKTLAMHKFEFEDNYQEAYELIYGDKGIGEENIDLYIAKKFIDASIMKREVRDDRMDSLRKYASTLRETKELRRIIDENSSALRIRNFQSFGVKDIKEIQRLQLECAKQVKDNPRMNHRELYDLARRKANETLAEVQEEIAPGVFVNKQEKKEIDKHTITLEDGKRICIFGEPSKLNKTAERMGIEYFACVVEHPSGKGVTLNVSSKKGIPFPDTFNGYAQKFVEEHKDEKCPKSYIFREVSNPKSISCFVVSTIQDPEAKIPDVSVKEYKDTLIKLFNGKEIKKDQNNRDEY